MRIYKTLKTNGALPEDFSTGVFIPFPIGKYSLEQFEGIKLKYGYDVMVIDNRKEIEDDGDED